MVTIARMQKLLLHYDNRPFESIDVILLICLFTQDTRSTRCNIKTIIKGDKSNLAKECGVKLFEQGVRNKECQQKFINTANLLLSITYDRFIRVLIV